jgi:hypothetical protein
MHIQANAAIAVFIFLIAYYFIVTRKLNEAVAALAGSLILILLGVVTQPEAIASIDFNTLGFLLGRMTVVDIARHSGLFDLLAPEILSFGFPTRGLRQRSVDRLRGEDRVLRPVSRSWCSKYSLISDTSSPPKVRPMRLMAIFSCRSLSGFLAHFLQDSGYTV